jgi:hypothetical protein
LVEEDANVTIGMDITQATGRVLEINLSRPESVTAACAEPAEQQPEQASYDAAQGAGSAQAAGTLLAAAGIAPTAQVDASDATPVSHVLPRRSARLSSGTDELAQGQAVNAQMNKWGFAPGADDTLDINLEKHGACNEWLNSAAAEAALLGIVWHAG